MTEFIYGFIKQNPKIDINQNMFNHCPRGVKRESSMTILPWLEPAGKRYRCNENFYHNYEDQNEQKM